MVLLRPTLASLGIVAVFTLGAGCASLPGGRASVRVWYLSDPPGATIHEGGRQWGNSPLWLRYYPPNGFRECLRVNPVKVRWVSGAEVDVTELDVCPANGREQQFTVFRPQGVAGAEIDAQYATALLQAGNSAAAPAPPAPLTPIAPPRFCTTTVIGNQILTTCT
jgi:hypothetical protein